ncbi:MAG TPA: MFS transporter [bacterium]|nr:MFS transporter [bacterium]HOL48729.1 MFS transporter [bacterium]HPQ20059.1 MFS transporter [bacterium]
MQTIKNNAIKIIIFFGLISLFGDIIYEGARSVNGPYLKILGANAVLVGFIAGISEFIGYFIRFFSGYISDKTKSHWLLTFIGYGLLISVPMLAFTSIWQFAAFLIIIERLGKAIRSPAKDTIVSLAANKVGTGFGFGLLEALDQIGALIGPAIFTIYFYFSKTNKNEITTYQNAYNLLWFPFLILIFCIILTYFKYSKILEEEKRTAEIKKDNLPKIFWLYSIFIFLTTIGFINFLLLSYHYKKFKILSDYQIPLFYAIAMIIDAFAAVVIGKLYDVLKEKKKNIYAGLLTLFIIPIFTLFIPLFGFSNNLFLIFIAVFIWGIVMATHETIMKSAIADITSLKKRGTGYGIFNSIYGLAMFIGSSLVGFFYEKNFFILINFIIFMQIFSCLILILIYKEIKKNKS